MTGRLDRRRRERELEHVTEGPAVDLLVVGLGVTGAGVALDAATRGLDVAAIDAHDLAFGTSRWSSKLIHGGLRYLAHGQVAVAYGSAVERGVLMAMTAPHLVRPLPMLLPLATGRERIARAGFLAGDALRAAARTSRGVLPRPRRLSGPEALALAPGLHRVGVTGALLSWDGQLEDDARLVVTLARTAAARGAKVLTRVRALELTGDGAVVRDELTGTTATVRARAVINATGAWAGSLVPGVTLRPSRGSHLVLRAGALPGLDVGVIIPMPGESNRFVLLLPQPDGLVYLGPTDEPVTGPLPDVPQPTEAEIGFLLDMAGMAVGRPLGRPDVVGAFAGLRPLLEAEGRTADLSRRHAVLTSPNGVITVVGGKLTTYRRMAEDALDAAIGRAGLTAGPCRTRRLPLLGAAPAARLVDVAAPARLVRRYGTQAPAVVATAVNLLGRDRPDVITRDVEQRVTAPIAAGLHVTMAELLWGVTHEGALDTDDLLDRRTRLGLVPADRAVAEAAAQEAIDLAGASWLS